MPSIAQAQESLDSGIIPSKPSNPFEKLVSDLSHILGPSSGLDSSDVDVKELQDITEMYVSSEEDWGKYAFEDLSRGYTRNLVDEGNGKSNLVSHETSVYLPPKRALNLSAIIERDD